MYASYHNINVTPERLKIRVDAMIKAVKKFHSKTPINHIVVQGMSGQAVGWPVGYKLGIPVAVVRKEKEKKSCHAGESPIIGDGHLTNYIIIDDGIYSGATIDRIVKAAKKDNSIAKCLGIFLYNQVEMCSVYCEKTKYKNIPMHKIEVRGY